MRNEFLAFSIISLGLVFIVGHYAWPPIFWLYFILVPIVLLGFYDMYQHKHAIMRNFPILGRGRYVMEELRPKLYQYFIESDTNGRPISRIFRSVVYQRAKRQLDTSPFGTQLDVYEEGYEWMNHSIAALDTHELDNDPRTKVGSQHCQQPYMASIFNVAAMSFGSLSKNAIEALNGGARIGGFAHNTGEGGISPYHEAQGGDLIYQVGTGYFGCRTEDGDFSPEAFAERTASPQVKMIELKLSQGAKPGHGGILPGRKNTPEIAQIRGVKVGTDVLSPPSHKTFSTPVGLLEFIRQMQDLSDFKPVGFKLCIGKKSEFIAICKAMVETGIYPDFITVDGGEGGTGAAPMEFSNSVGMPYREGLAFAYDALVGFDLKQHVKLFTSGKIMTGFHIFQSIALGADATYSARAMMLALGCIQALECNQNTCPTGVATQDKELVAGLVVSDKRVRVANYHQETLHSFVELMAAAGISDPAQINRSHIYRRISVNEVRRYDELYPPLVKGCMLKESTVPEVYRKDWQEANPDRF
ncbi:FMN-binding glutamate synthase family protein [Flavilitoribacter nigricans]|uniref:FMN-binding glutamate synthase family protein n=1 Tax=Flavilitoribacter nigricans (strain ATCC 23147 / DSM 23189 / NBRC 102662 / NCIMB 1420 / SS-2) TaxID=1122177 RepID=A0A2D0NGB1_FLAN2|nr:FMN-binding glutamate synthase family protein [Flavilitoribacter nigricans]PHN07544.1 FMN-binding glutamate synthase family protein [Flavilitoribacter nigricans DSM 23189 = NBRC 102662]